jgi:hypothetical protein
MMIAKRGTTNEGFIALDQFEFVGTAQCQFAPQEAIPVSTTFQPTSSTPIPTEPPIGKLRSQYNVLGFSNCGTF